MMVKVLQILPSTSASCGDTGVVMNYYRNIDRERVHFDFATMLDFPDCRDDEIKSMGGNVFHFDKPGLFSIKKTVNQIRNIILKSGCDIVHLHAPVLYWPVKKALKGTNCKKLILHSHSTKLSKSKIRAIRNRILTIGIGKGDSGRFACSFDAGKSLFGKKWGKSSNDHLIYNAINLENFVYSEQKAIKMREQFNLTSKNIAFCHVGRFSPEKNHDRLVDIFKAIKSKEPNAKLFLIGDGPLKNEIVEKVSRENLNNDIIFLGKRNDVHDVLQAMDVFILPSFFEGLCLSLVEAQAVGLLCFYSETCVKDSMITDNIVQISLNKDNNYWADKILERFSKGWDRDTTKRIQSENYDIKLEAEKLLKKYEEIVNE